MQDNLFVFSAMAFVQSKHNLSENAPNEVLANILASLILPTLLDQFGQITSFAVFHDQIYRSVLFVNEFVEAPHNVISFDLTQNLHFIIQLLPLFFAHASIVGYFPDHFSARGYMENFCHFSKRSYQPAKFTFYRSIKTDFNIHLPWPIALSSTL